MSEILRDQLLAALGGCNLDADLIEWLRHGLEVQAAGGDMLVEMDLEGPDLDRRDALIQLAVAAAPGESLTARAVYLVDALDGRQRPPKGELSALVVKLRSLNVPRSVKQLRRIISGRRQDGRDIKPDLCPSWPVVQAVTTTHSGNDDDEYSEPGKPDAPRRRAGLAVSGRR